ncbi:hypothetical protein ABE42_37935 [Bacillus thuringiensis]|uniref:DUF4257 domain-containing protein n=1 Tax=Bacillus thuringiensis TaxID=1428 RepID=A0A437SMN7_BACTU|nr:DUF4257 domain-containing protein [Bacillus thuringiensis]MDA2583472.1 DUF4257 domain-containing protein [Bacillus cereus]MBG9485931.1 hypothetical protein [Bacillus thuringiensis]MBG9512901.1 hypothetical protein [Bacillus thuringiensis]MBG9536687.1 hypothetical protein [Bacillus thuringiensis]MBG9540775.1 hypothetical protein [Bacillus thuringiensis]
MEMFYVLYTIIIGSIIGLVFHFIYHQEGILVPRYVKYMFHFGFLKDIIIGSLAACFGLILFDMTTIGKVLLVASMTAISAQIFLLHQILTEEREKNASMNRIKETISKIKQ